MGWITCGMWSGMQGGMRDARDGPTDRSLSLSLYLYIHYEYIYGQ